MDTDNILKFFRSKAFVIVIIALFGLALLAGAFGLGIFVGYRKATFSYRWGENYHLNFGGPRGGFFQNFQDLGGRDFIGAHGVFGQIIKIDDQTLVIKGQDNVERVVLVKSDTSIRRLGENIKLGDLKTNEYITVIGEPNDSGQIEAKFIRVMPLPSPSAPMPRPRMR
jgi:hypothetical protein